MSTTTEPVRAAAALNAALVATAALLQALDLLSADVAAALTGALAGWIMFVGEWARSRVTPNGRVAMTTDQATELRRALPR